MQWVTQMRWAQSKCVLRMPWVPSCVMYSLVPRCENARSPHRGCLSHTIFTHFSLSYIHTAQYGWARTMRANFLLVWVGRSVRRLVIETKILKSVSDAIRKARFPSLPLDKVFMPLLSIPNLCRTTFFATHVINQDKWGGCFCSCWILAKIKTKSY